MSEHRPNTSRKEIMPLLNVVLLYIWIKITYIYVDVIPFNVIGRKIVLFFRYTSFENMHTPFQWKWGKSKLLGVYFIVLANPFGYILLC